MKPGDLTEFTKLAFGKEVTDMVRKFKPNLSGYIKSKQGIRRSLAVGRFNVQRRKGKFKPTASFLDDPSTAGVGKKPFIRFGEST
jgi:hypothetical protein